MARTNSAISIVRLIELINSHGVGFSTGVDQLDDPESALRLIKQVVPTARSADAAAVAKVRNLRDALLRLIANSEDKSARKILNAVSEEVQYNIRFSPTTESELLQRSGDPIVGAILNDVSGIMGEGYWNRLKICANEACASVFFDATRSNTQHWHSYAACENKNNVAPFRSHHTRRKTMDDLA